MHKNIKIVGTGRAPAKTFVDNDALSTFLETDYAWIVGKTGIKTRAILIEETLTDKAAEAAQKALEAAQKTLNARPPDLVLCATIGGDYATPALACCLAERLGLSCPAFDLNAACTGFVYGLDVADAYIRAGKAETILLVCAEKMSRLVDWTDRATCILFGDGAAACVITAGSALRYIRIGCDPSTALLNAPNTGGYRDAGTAPALRMMGPEVYKFAVRTIEHEIDAALSALDIAAEDIDYFLLHQANARIVEGARARLKLPAAKFPTNILRYGNMSAASIPVLLDELCETGIIEKNQTLMFIGFGAGMTVGTAVMRWE